MVRILFPFILLYIACQLARTKYWSGEFYFSKIQAYLVSCTGIVKSPRSTRTVKLILSALPGQGRGGRRGGQRGRQKTENALYWFFKFPNEIIVNNIGLIWHPKLRKTIPLNRFCWERRCFDSEITKPFLVKIKWLQSWGNKNINAVEKSSKEFKKRTKATSKNTCRQDNLPGVG